MQEEKSFKEKFFGNVVKGFSFEEGVDYDKLLSSYENQGFQSKYFSEAVKIINEILKLRYSSDNHTDNVNIILGYTSNMISSGIREFIHFLVKNKFVDVVITTTGGIEEDMIKAISDEFFVAKEELNGDDCFKEGICRICNLILPNNGYDKFYEFMKKILSDCNQKQQKFKKIYTPSRLIRKIGKNLKYESSVYRQCFLNDIPVFCPALSDGAFGDIFYFQKYKDPGLIIDVVGDVKLFTDLVKKGKKSAMIIIGGGVTKYHITNAMKKRGGSDYAVYVNTSHKFECSQNGADFEEDMINGVIKEDSKYVKLNAEATLVFPLLVGETFAKFYKKNKNNVTKKLKKKPEMDK